MAAGQIMRTCDVDLVALHELVGHLFPPPGCCAVERTEEGVSTQVYRIRRDDEIFYLRVADERDASLAPEVCVHELLRERGVKVPDIVYFEPFDARLQRSIMVTTEIRGEHVGHRRVDGDTKEVLRAAGRDLAVINSVPVEGFGWIKRDKSAVIRLEAEHTTHRDFALEHLDEHLTLLSEKVLTEAEIVEIRTIISRYDAWLDVQHACLAHGDFDVTHIYQQDGQYTGIIDFGEIRGAGPLYDLGHCNLHDGETLPQPVLPFLLAGYAEVIPLPPDHQQGISLASMLIGVRALARTLRRPPNDYQRHLTQSLRRAVAALRA
jgi:aminoglycoside phosphotransferase (APT) family kinase protein